MAALALATSLHATATASTTPPPAEPAPIALDKLEVTADRAPSLTSPSLASSRAELLTVPGGTEVIDSARYLRGRASTVEDTFALSAGVIAQSRFGSDEARLSIRGSGLQRTFHGRGLRVLQDGVPINLADGGFDMQALEPLSAAYINVWRGGNALATGASTLGGAIDYISRTGRDAPALFARAEAGSWNYLRASLASGGTTGARNQFDGYASFTHQSQDGFRDHAEQSNQRLFANAGIRFSGFAETRFYVTAARTDSELPGSLSRAQLDTNPQQSLASNITLDQHRDFDLLRLANKTTIRTGETTWDFSAAWTYKDLDHPIFQVIDQLSNDALLGASATHTGDFLGRSNRLRAGVFFTRGLTHATNFINASGKRGALVSQADQTATNLELFAEDQLTLGRGLTLVAGFSSAANKRENEKITGGVASYELDYDRLMPKLGLRWDARDIQVFANFSGSYEPPSFSETLTLNTARNAQTATTVELGTRGIHRFLRWDLSLYSAELKNELLTLDHDNNPSTAAATINANRTTHRGIEFATELDLLGTDWNATTTPTHRLVARAAWTYGDFRFDSDARYGNNRLAGLAPHQIRGELTWEHASGWYAGPTFEWSPKDNYIDFRNTFAADAYALIGLRLGQRRATGISWFLEARNLSDKRYAATTGVIENATGLDQPQFLPGDGRSLFAGLEYRW
ncbi:TonB-dependent receptor [Nibricoccus aquaticus]|uniref:TonB-dependent receptor n=1 Tax=Nibricoccus aquaticus TaxID=2576891 RepID=A0A290QL39_9BACT|nr:TonB-dependent receptor [Nibricoccus aquaticus]